MAQPPIEDETIIATSDGPRAIWEEYHQDRWSLPKNLDLTSFFSEDLVVNFRCHPHDVELIKL